MSEERQRPLESVLISPLEAHIQLSNVCDYGCEHCRFFLDAGRQRLSAHEWKRVVATLAEKDIWHILLIAPQCGNIDELPEILSTANELGQEVELFVGGPMPAERFWTGLFNVGLRTVIFEVFGGCEFHNLRTKPGSYEQILVAMKAALRLGIDVIAAVPLHKGIGGYIEPLLMSLPTGIRGVVFQHFIPFKEYQRVYTIPEKESMRLWQSAKKLAGSVPIRYSSCGRSTDPEVLKRCSAGRFKLALDCNGIALPCEHFCRRPEATLGSLLTDGLEKIWAAPLLEQIRRMNPDTYGGVCGECPARYRCSSCRALGFNFFGDVSASVPACGVFS